MKGFFPTLFSCFGSLALAAQITDSISSANLLGNFFAPPGFNATFDYVVVGAGTAGLALATRLAEAGQHVAVIEAGGYTQFLNGNVRSLRSKFLEGEMDADCRYQVHGCSFVCGLLYWHRSAHLQPTHRLGRPDPPHAGQPTLMFCRRKSPRSHDVLRVSRASPLHTRRAKPLAAPRRATT